MKTTTRPAKRRKAKEPGADYAAGYNAFKEFEGQRYTGMKIGRSHKWYYDQGEWKEKKITPDKWEFTYAVTKRRAGKAPEGSGVPVGTEYHWYIVAHQNVKKLNANDYSTSLAGLKFKVAHKRADTGKWSASDRAQRRRMIKLLEEMIQDLQRQEAEPPAAPAETPALHPSNGNGRHDGKASHAAPRRAAGRAHAQPARRRHEPSADGSAVGAGGNGKRRGRTIAAAR
jgi:hypothetical protein